MLPVFCCWLLLMNFLFSVIVFHTPAFLNFKSCFSLFSVCYKLTIFASSLFPMSCIIFTIISLKSFSWKLIISRSLSYFSVFLLLLLLFTYLSYSSLPFHFYMSLALSPFCKQYSCSLSCFLLSMPLMTEVGSRSCCRLPYGRDWCLNTGRWAVSLGEIRGSCVLTGRWG